MADQCPDNSTECLLRAILDADSGYNWNPITFAFTVLFTVIAFLVSLVALFQSFIAASPARLKASERAIGPRDYKARTKTSFNWKEFRFRTIVDVPVIEIDRILQNNPGTITIQGQNDNAPVASAAGRIVAGWAQLICDLSLQDVKFNTIQCLTDYLPDDIPAAPAWARMEGIVLLAIMKGCTLLRENQDGFIDATGLNAQLSWNMHPTLGPIAVYRTWDIENTMLHKFREVQKMLPVSRGELYLKGEKILRLLPRRRNDIPVVFDFPLLKDLTQTILNGCRHEHDHCIARKRGVWAGYLASKSQDYGDGVEKRTAALTAALFADRPTKPMAYPLNVIKMHLAIKSMFDEYFPWLILADDFDDSVLERLCGSSFVEFDEWDAKPDSSSLYDDEHLSSWLPILTGRTLGKSNRSFTIHRPVLQYVNSKLNSRPPSRASRRASREKLDTSGIRISRNAVQSVSKWLSDNTYFHMSTTRELVKARLWLMWQLAEVDWFLSTYDSNTVCASSNLVALGCIKFGLVQVTRVSRRFVLPETLKTFNLDWKVDPDDTGSIIIDGYLDPDTKHKLYTYSKAYIDKHVKDYHTVKCTRAAQGYYYAKNKRAKSEPPMSVSKMLPTGTDAMLDSINPVGVELRTAEETKDPINVIRSISNDKTEVDLKSFSREEPAILPSIEVDPVVDNPFDNPTTAEWLQRTGSAEDEVAVRIDQGVAALEAFTFFRACLFGALLATGVDTSVVLTSDKRYQLVQVQ